MAIQQEGERTEISFASLLALLHSLMARGSLVEYRKWMARKIESFAKVAMFLIARFSFYTIKRRVMKVSTLGKRRVIIFPWTSVAHDELYG